MNRSPDSVLPRMPGSAVFALVLLALQALVGLIAGIALAPYLPQGLAVLLFMGGMVNAAIAIGLGLCKNWARVTGLILSGIAIGASVLGLLIAAVDGAPLGNPGAIGISIGLFVLLSHKNTRAWCGVGEPDVLGPLDEPAEPFVLRDRVELVEGIDETGLRAGAVGTVIDLPAVPGTVVVEFDDHADREPVQVSLHTSEIKLASAAE